jgi:hypothetical protein
MRLRVRVPFDRDFIESLAQLLREDLQQILPSPFNFALPES